VAQSVCQTPGHVSLTECLEPIFNELTACSVSNIILPTGKSSDGSGYDWAIVSGGPPRTTTQAGGCAAGPLNPTFLDVNGSGEPQTFRGYLKPPGLKWFTPVSQKVFVSSAAVSSW